MAYVRDTVEAFGGSPNMHKALVEGILKDLRRVRNANSITDTEHRTTEQDVSDTVKAVLERTNDNTGSSKMSWQTTICWGWTNTPTRSTRWYTSLGTIKQAG